MFTAEPDRTRLFGRSRARAVADAAAELGHEGFFQIQLRAGGLVVGADDLAAAEHGGVGGGFDDDFAAGVEGGDVYVDLVASV